MVLTILTPTPGISSGAATMRDEWVSLTLTKECRKTIFVVAANGGKVEFISNGQLVIALESLRRILE